MSKKVAMTSLLTIMLLVGLVKLFPETIKETYAIGSTLADTVINAATTEACNADGTGVCATNAYTNPDGLPMYHDYRYRGADPNNYVKFNNDLYRIIGVFDDITHGVEGQYLVKLIMSDKLYAGSWGIYSTSDNVSNGTYSSYKNDWTGSVTGVKANANILLNEYFYEKSNISDAYGACSNWTYYYSNTNYRTYSCSDIVGHGIDSSLQNYIQETTWYLKGYTGNEYSKQNFYLCERGQSTDTTNCMSGNSGAYDASTTGKIGLMYASDYLYASSYFADTSTQSGSSEYYGNKNWLYKGYEWTITPDADSSTDVFFVYSDGAVSSNSSNKGNGARPTLYLKSGVGITGGSGTINDPYIISS